MDTGGGLRYSGGPRRRGGICVDPEPANWRPTRPGRSHLGPGIFRGREVIQSLRGGLPKPTPQYCAAFALDGETGRFARCLRRLGGVRRRGLATCGPLVPPRDVVRPEPRGRGGYRSGHDDAGAEIVPPVPARDQLSLVPDPNPAPPRERPKATAGPVERG